MTKIFIARDDEDTSPVDVTNQVVALGLQVLELEARLATEVPQWRKIEKKTFV